MSAFRLRQVATVNTLDDTCVIANAYMLLALFPNADMLRQLALHYVIFKRDNLPGVRRSNEL